MEKQKAHEPTLTETVQSWLKPVSRRYCPVCLGGTLKFDGTCDVCGVKQAKP